MRYDKIKSSDHFLIRNRITIIEAEKIIRNPKRIKRQYHEDLDLVRYEFIGYDNYHVIVSAAVSAGSLIGRLVTAF